MSYPILTKSNYTGWLLKMKVDMQGHGIWEAIEPKNTKEMIEDKTYISRDPWGYINVSREEKDNKRGMWSSEDNVFGCTSGEKGKDPYVQGWIRVLKHERLNSKLIDDFCMKLNGQVTIIRKIGIKTIEVAYIVKRLLRVIPAKFL